MQETAVVLSVLRERGRRGLPCTQLYRQMFNKDLYLLAYGNIYPNKGAMTPGSGGETADGMSEGKIDQIIELMRHERYRFPPARRLYIPKKNGKLRPLGLPDWSGKIVGEVIRLLLEAYYEPSFSDRSHGFRKGRGCHTALREVRDAWTGTVWFIEGDISDCYGSMDHQILLSILAEKIDDQRFLRLVRNMLKAGYLEDWVRHDTLSGVPQGGVASPILSCIYLDKLDKFVEQELIPQYTRGVSRILNPEYRETANRLRNARRRGDRAEARELGKRLRGLPSRDPMDPGYRRLKYIRYADDHLLGFMGPKAEAEQIKARLATFLRETLGLELNQDKTLISHARTQPARFLGYDIIVQHGNTRITRGRRAANGIAALRVPPDVVKAKCAPYRQHGKPWHRPELQNLPDYDIVRIYGAEYRGVVNYYLLAQDVARLTALRWNAETSMLKTLAAKHKSTVATMAARHKAQVITGDGPRTCFEASLKREGRKDLVARFGGIILRQDRRAVIHDPAPVPVHAPRKELIHRLLKRRCELCEQSATVAVHQVAGLKQLGEPGPGQPAWAALMARMRRKTLIVCTACHDYIHANPVSARRKSLESLVRLTAHAGFGGRLHGLAVQPTLHLLRHGAMDVLFGGVRAPSTLGSHLRSYTWGNVRQLEAVNRQLLAELARRAPLLPGADQLAFLDIDAMQKRVYGHKKHGARFGHTKIQGKSLLVRGLNALTAVVSTPLSAPVIAATRLRGGNAASARGAASFAAGAITTAREAGCDGLIVVRMDSAYYAARVIAAIRRAGARFSVTVPMDPKVKAAIAGIGEDAWTAIRYPRAIWDDQLRAWVSDAQVAEAQYTAFTSKKGQAVTARLIVRRVRDLNKQATAGQDELFPLWRYHAVFTDSPFELIQAEGQHRDHAIIEQVFADVTDGPLAHMPSGSFPANAAWTACAAIAHNLLRAAGALASLAYARARGATLRRDLISVAARTARSGRGHITLHLPEGWHREHEWMTLFAAACGPPARAA